MKKTLVPILATVLLITIAPIKYAMACRIISRPGKESLVTSSCFTGNGRLLRGLPKHHSEHALDACAGSYPAGDKGRLEWNRCLVREDGGVFQRRKSLWNFRKKLTPHVRIDGGADPPKAQIRHQRSGLRRVDFWHGLRVIYYDPALPPHLAHSMYLALVTIPAAAATADDPHFDAIAGFIPISPQSFMQSYSLYAFPSASERGWMAAKIKNNRKMPIIGDLAGQVAAPTTSKPDTETARGRCRFAVATTSHFPDVTPDLVRHEV